MALIGFVRSTSRYFGRNADPRSNGIDAPFDAASAEFLSQHLLKLTSRGFESIIFGLVPCRVGDAGNRRDVDYGGGWPW